MKISMKTSFLQSVLFLAVCALVFPTAVLAHGVIGQRFFVESVSVEDPFPSDEMDLLAFSHQKDNESLVNEYSGGISKRLSPNLSIGIDWAYDNVRPNDGSPTVHGFDNIGMDIKFNMVRLPEHEFLATAALGWDIGGTGDRNIGESHSSLTPSILFGYGLGDLPDSLQYLRPFGITGQFGITSPVGNLEETPVSTLNYGLVVEYSLLYLQSFVKDVGIQWPFNRLVPMVEFAGSSPLNGTNGVTTTPGVTTLTAYPGVTWAGRYYQMTVEAIVPMNDQSGHHTGVQGLFHLYLDDLFPNVYTWTPFHGVLGPTQR